MTLIKSRFPYLTDFFGDDWMQTNWKNSDWSPAVNVVDNKDSFEIEVAAPGLKKDDFKVSVENSVLTIKGETSKEEEEKTKNYTRKEFSSRSFTKSFTLPENIEGDNVKAKYDEGVLRLRLNKSTVELPPKREVVIE